MKSNIQETPFKQGVMVKVYKRKGFKPVPHAVQLDTPYIGQLDCTLAVGMPILIGMAQLGSAGPSLHWLQTTPLVDITITDGNKAVAQTQSGSTYEVELLPDNYALQPGDLHP